MFVIALGAGVMGTASPKPAGAASAPTVTGASPAAGPAVGGTEVTISGTGFVDGAAVTFNGVAATNVVVVSGTQITATTPAGSPGQATIIVTNGDGKGSALGGAFAYLGPVPTITGISPTHGPATGDTLVTVTGTGFAAGTVVRFGGVLATSVTLVDPTRITAKTPSHDAGSVTVEVTNPDTQSGSVTNGFAFDAVPPPTVQAVSPSSGTTGGGTAVTIVGTGFRAGVTVRFGGALATNVTVTSDTQMTAVTPSQTGMVAVQVTNADGQSGQLNNAFTYVSTPSPTVSDVSPGSGAIAGGNSIRITGTGFLNGASVTFGGVSAGAVSVLSSAEISVLVPAASAPGTVGVRVTNTDGKSGSQSNAYTYLGPPAVTRVSPSAGSTLGGTVVTITGTNFIAGATVSFGGSPATDVAVLSGTQISVRTPPHTAGATSVIVQSGGLQGSRSSAYVYRAPPVVTGVAPASGPTAGGTRITIGGRDFTDGVSVTVGGVLASNVVIVNGTTLTATTPARPDGAAAIEVRTLDGIGSLGSVSFVYMASPGTFDRSLSAPGVNAAIWNGGSVDQLIAAAGAQSGISVTTFLGGRSVTLVVGAPAFVNAAFRAAYPSGLPKGVILLVVR